jgi:hypothetical protein
MGRWLTCPNQLSSFNLVLSGICTCQPRLQTSHQSGWEDSDALASTHSCTTVADALVNYRKYVHQRPSTIPSPQWDALLTHAQIDSRLGLWVLPLSTSTRYVSSAPETSKVPIAPIGDSRFARFLQGGGVYVDGGSVSIVNSQIYSNTASHVRTHLQKFPSPPWDSRFARCLQGGAVYVLSGTVTITSSSIYGNKASSVRAHVQ